jgi:tape measure domain-containing protein
MAKTVQPIAIELGIKGGEKLAALNSSFRDLSKQVKLSDADITQATKDIVKFATEAGNSEATIKGQIKAFEGLREQAALGGKAYIQLGKDIESLKVTLRGSTDEMEQQRAAFVKTGNAAKSSASDIAGVISQLENLRNKARPGSSAFAQLGKDIAALKSQLQEANVEVKKFNAGFEISQRPAMSLEKIQRQIGRLAEGLKSLNFISNEFLNVQERIALLGQVQGRTTARQQVRAQAQMYSSAAFAKFVEGPVGKLSLPNTTAALQLEVSELQQKLVNLDRSSSDYTATAMRLADAQRKLAQDVMGLSSAYDKLEAAEAGAARRAGKVAGIQQYYAGGAGAPGVAGFRDPATGAIIARGVGNIADRRAFNAARRDLANAILSGAIEQARTLALPAAGGTAAPGTGQAISGGARRIGVAREVVRGVPSVDIAPAAIGMSEQAIRSQAQAAKEAASSLKPYRAAIREAAAANNGSIHSLEAYRAALVNMRNEVPSTSASFERLTKRIQATDDQLEKLAMRQRGRRRMSPMQMTQAAGAAISGGIFGGPEGFLGGAIGAIGGVGSAFAGAAIGAQVGGLRRQLGEFADYAAGIQKLQIALRGVAGSQDEFNRAMAAASSVTKELNVPQDVAIQGMTRLTAAVKGAGGGVADAELAFKNINSAIIATGGGAEQVEGAVTALVQIFSKGKVSAEEINQIAERLPGTFNKIAAASGRTGPELTKALQDGKVGLSDLMKFLVQLGGDYNALAEKIAQSSESAGARLQVAYDKMRQEVGKALQPIGAEFQAAFTEFIEDITPSLVSAAKAVGDGLRFVIQNKEAIAVAASFAIKLAAVNLALKAFAALNGPVSTMFALLRTGFKATSQQAALAQTRLAAFGKTVKALAVSLAAPIVITFAVIGAEMVIAYFNRIKQARADLEATARKPQGDVFFRSIGGTAATKQTLQSNINDITKNLDILRDRVKSTKKELQTLEETARTTYGGAGGGLPVEGVTDRSREDLKTRLQADEAEIKRLVLNYRTLVDRYIAAPDAAAGLTDAEGKGGAGGGNAARDAERIAQQLAQIKLQGDAIERSKALLNVNTEIRETARQIIFAQTENNTQKAYALRQDAISLEFLKKDLEIQLDYQKAVEAAALEENAQIRAAQLQLAEKQRIFGIEENINNAINDRIGLVQENTIELKKQAEALEDARFGLREQLGMVDPKERVARAQEEFRKQYPGATAEDLDLIRQQIDPTPFEKVQQNITQLKTELGELVKSANQITGAASAIGNAFSQSFVDAISGSKTAKEALADFFSSVGSYFLDMAKQIIAKMITIAILNSVAKLLPSGGGPLGDGVPANDLGRLMGPNPIMPRANGGPVNANQPYIVGERGPELFVPSSNGMVMSNAETRTALNRQLDNRRSNATTETMQAKPLEVKYESTVINNVEYVTAEQHRKGMAQAAERGRALTLQALQNSVKTRSRVGI